VHGHEAGAAELRSPYGKNARVQIHVISVKVNGLTKP
jgi:hypothetical protein